VLLIVSAGSLSVGLPYIANGVAVCGYCALVVGVVLQLACFVKYRSKTVDEVDDL
jgi:hypothetical protein